MAPTCPPGDTCVCHGSEFPTPALVRLRSGFGSLHTIWSVSSDPVSIKTVASRTWPPSLSASATRLGQLERGLGSGARWALEGGDVAIELLLRCLAVDPRWDHEIDSRELYYADLALALRVDVGAIEALLVAHDARAKADELARMPLSLRVLGTMASRGNADAIAALRRAALNSRYWVDAIDLLVYDCHDELAADRGPRVEGLAEGLCIRFPSAAQLEDALDQSGPLDGDRLPWAVWLETFPTIREAIGHEETPGEQRWGISVPIYTFVTTADLLSGEARRPRDLVIHALRRRTSSDDVAAMLAAAADPMAPMSGVAALALARQGNLAVLPFVVDLPNRLTQTSHPLSLRRAFLALPFAHTRATAYEWLKGDYDGSVRSAAAHVLSDHAGVNDVEFCRRMLDRELDAGLDGDQYIVSGLAEAIGRHDRGLAYPELTRAYREMTYSFGRHFVVEAIAATDPDFPRGLAIDCLWDCEPSIRALGIQHVSVTHPGVSDRLGQLARDPLDEPEVRQQATANH